MQGSWLPLSQSKKALHWAKLVSVCTILMMGIKVGEILSMAMCNLLFSWC